MQLATIRNRLSRLAHVYAAETNRLRTEIISRIVSLRDVAFAAMLPIPRSIVIGLVLLDGVLLRLHAQTSPSPSPIYYLIEHVDFRTDDGLRGFEIGTQVELIQDLGDRVRVKNGDQGIPLLIST